MPGAAPTNLTASYISFNSLVLSWIAPPQVFTNGPLIGYNVSITSQFAIKGEFVKRFVFVNIPRELSVEIGNLESFQPYLAAVSAVNEAGMGPWSKVVRFITNATGMSMLLLMAAA